MSAQHPVKIAFLGTPAFAVPSLDVLLKNDFNVVGVITSPDQPAGRGLQLTSSPVKKYAVQHQLKIFQPSNLKDNNFLNEIKWLNPDLMVVVAFRMMPRELWQMPKLGTFNLHASLLPQYRGAAPINHVIMNGEKETGVTTFFLKHEIDTGNILFSEKVFIGDNETAGELHDRLMNLGAELVLKTVKAIASGNAKEIRQESLLNENIQIHTAPKILKEDCRINWNEHIEKIHNHVRGLSPYPAAFSIFQSPEGKDYNVKIFKTKKENTSLPVKPGMIETDSKTFLKISGNDGFLLILEMQLPGKSKLPIADLLRGFSIDNNWKIISK